jgi:hypothetical protein
MTVGRYWETENVRKFAFYFWTEMNVIHWKEFCFSFLQNYLRISDKLQYIFKRSWHQMLSEKNMLRIIKYWQINVSYRIIKHW